uniref:Uncharacterized protein n=1 Tax=Anguilla anguilla TaxID=7936 RepID=A0A0E9WWL7_ANGAN
MGLSSGGTAVSRIRRQFRRRPTSGVWRTCRFQSSRTRSDLTGPDRQLPQTLYIQNLCREPTAHLKTQAESHLIPGSFHSLKPKDISLGQTHCQLFQTSKKLTTILFFFRFLI